MQRQRIGRIAGIILAILVTAGVLGWAQSGDTPIVIMDGSLTMDLGVPSSQFKGTGDRRSHPNSSKTVTKVVVTVAGNDQTITFNKQQCTVDVTYSGTDIKVTTGRNGKGLSVSPFSAFQDGDTPNHMAHKDQSQKISHVTVKKAGVTAFDSDASGGGTKVVISYE